jgi:DNA-binding response OmpR family regulator
MVANPGAYQSPLPLAGLDVLLVRHESAVAFVVEDMLFDLGAERVWHAADVEAALALLRDRRPGVAVVEVSLAGEPAEPIAARLAAAGIPAVFVTGYGPDERRRRWSHCVTVQKPFRPATLASALRAVLDVGHPPRPA